MEALFSSDWFSSSSASVVRFLLAVSLKSTGILLVALLVTQLLKHRSAATRHLIWSLAVLAILLLPLFSLVVPLWRVPLVPAFFATQSHLLETASRQEYLSDSNGLSTQDSNDDLVPVESKQLSPDGETHLHQAIGISSKNAPLPSTKDRIVTFAKALAANDVTIAALFIWLIGTALFFIRQLFGRVAILLLASEASEINDVSWRKMAKPLLERLGIRRKVVFLKNTDATMPMTWGSIRPKVMLPAEADDWTSDRKRIVLLHELAHVKRWDALTQFIAQLVAALYWFNPFIWLAHRQLLKERERACDDFVLQENSKPSDYASLLLEIARSPIRGRFAAVAGVTMARPTQLEGRMLAILDPKLRRGVLSRFTVLVASALVISIVVPLAAMRPASKGLLEKTTIGAEPPTATESAAPEAPGVEGTPELPAAVLSSVESSAAPREEERPPKERSEEAASEIEIGAETATKELAEENSLLAASVEAPGVLPLQDRESLVIRSLSEALRDSSVEVRMQAARTLGDIRSRSSAQALIAALQDQNWQMRQAVAKALGSIEDPSSVQALAASLRDDNRQVRHAAVRALGSIGDKSAVQALIAALQDSEAEVRSQAAWALGEIQDPRAAPALGSALKDENSNVRQQAIEALGEIDDPSAIGPLTTALTDTDWQVRQKAARALGEIDDPAAVTSLTSLLKDENWEVRKTAVWALGEIDDRRAVRPLVGSLTDTNWEVRKQAAWALGEIEDPAAAQPLRAVIKDPHLEVRKYAVWALGQIEDPVSIEPLGEALQDQDWEIRQRAARALGEVDDAAAIDVLGAALKDENSEVRKTVVWALGEIDDALAVPYLLNMTDDPDWEVRKQTAWALGEIQDPSAVSALGAALKDENREVRKTALWGLGEIRDRGAVGPLIEALSDEDWEIRSRAVRALGEIGDPRALEPLSAALKDDNAEVRKSAARALGELKWRD